MPIYVRYVSRLFLVRFALLLAGLAALVALLDVMAHGGAVIAADGAAALFRYAGLRLPLITSKLVPFSVLIAALLTLVSLVRHHELVVLIAAGVSQFRLILAFAPVVLVVAAAHFWLDERMAPVAVAELRDWGVADYSAGGRTAGGAMTWVRDGNDVVRVRYVAAGGDGLAGVTIFRRDTEGNLAERIDAMAAAYKSGAWVLYDVARLSLADNAVVTAARMPWDGNLRPSLIASLSAHPRELTFGEVRRYVDAPGFGSRPLYVYQIWLNRKIVAPLASLLMILIAVPLTQRFQTYGGAALTITVGVAIGFCFFVFDGFSLAVGEAGLLPPWVAAWAPTLAFASVGGAIGFHAERR